MRKILKKFKHRISTYLPSRFYWTLAGFLNPFSAAIEGQKEAETFYKLGNDEIALFNKLNILKPKQKTLEIGCGPGRIQYALTTMEKFDGEAYGTDFSSSMIAKAKRYVPRGKFSVGNGNTLQQYEDDFFDMVYSFVVFQHMDEEIFVNYLMESHRVLKQNGFLLFQIQSSEDVQNYVRPRKHPWHVRKYTRLELSKLLNTTKFYNINVFDMKGSPDPNHVDDSGFLVRAQKERN